MSFAGHLARRPDGFLPRDLLFAHKLVGWRRLPGTGQPPHMYGSNALRPALAAGRHPKLVEKPVEPGKVKSSEQIREEGQEEQKLHKQLISDTECWFEFASCRGLWRNEFVRPARGLPEAD